MQLFFTADGQRLFLARKETVVAGSINYLTARVDFSEKDWDGLEKWMHFSLGDKHYVINLIDDQITAERGVNLCAGDWAVYMHGNIIENGETKQRITTNKIKMKVLETGDLNGEPFPDIPPSSGEQIIAQTVAARDAAAASEQDAATSAKVATDCAAETVSAAQVARASAESASASERVAQKSAAESERYARLSEQQALTHGSMYCYIDETGRLHYVRSDNLDDLNLQLKDGRLRMSYGV